MLSATGAAAPHLELAVILWGVFTALRTFTNAQSFVKLIVSGPSKAAECAAAEKRQVNGEQPGSARSQRRRKMGKESGKEQKIIRP